MPAAASSSERRLPDTMQSGKPDTWVEVVAAAEVPQ
jgi:hypothetical protein